jgi:acetolactate synthase small subunit
VQGLFEPLCLSHAISIQSAAIPGKPMPTFVVYARKTPTVLGRVVLLFHGRAIEIERLTVERAENSDVLCITIDVEVASEQIPRIEATLYKLVDVLNVESGNESKPSCLGQGRRWNSR